MNGPYGEPSTSNQSIEIETMNKILLCFLITVVLGIIAFLIWYFFIKRSHSTTTNQPMSSTTSKPTSSTTSKPTSSTTSKPTSSTSTPTSSTSTPTSSTSTPN